MEVLNKHDKAIYDTLMNVVKFEKIEYIDRPIPKGWMDDIKRVTNR